MREKSIPGKVALKGEESGELLVIWDRSLPIPVVRGGNGKQNKFPGKRKVCCLWVGGFIANRSDLISQWELPGDISDHQLLVHLYQEYGIEVGQQLAGPFAWTLWDGNRKMLISASARMGNHRLYYTLAGDTVLLSNRVEPLLDELPSPGILNPRSVVGMLNGEAPLSGETFYENINAVEWGGLLIVTPKSIDNTLYWKPEPQPLLRLPSDDQYADALKELLLRVAAQYTPTCPMGIMVSSGIDSTSVAAAIRTAVPEADLTAFTFVTPELPDSDESPYTSAVSRHLNIQEVNIRADLYWPLSSVEGIRTPKSDPSYNLFAEAWKKTYQEVNQRKIKVILTGSGGDNLFGFSTVSYPDLLLSGRWVQLIRQFRTHFVDTKMTFFKMVRRLILAPIFKTYVPGWRRLKLPVPWLGKPYLNLYRECFGQAKKSWRMLPGRHQRLTLLCQPTLRLGIALINAEGEAHDIEFRHPLLDHRLIEFAASLPASQTFRPGKSKFILRNAMRGCLPDEVLNLHRKINSYALAHRGYRERGQDKIWPLLTNMHAAAMGFVDETEVQSAYKKYLNDSKPSKFIYAAILEDWLRRYF